MNGQVMNKTGLRYIAYVRKSEERNERQELSLQSQTNKIREMFPELNIIKWMSAESQSAFKPGRPIFNRMLDMIEAGEADAIVAWHPNRLARNEYDSARVTWNLRGPLKDLKFCSYNFDNSAEGIMMLQFVMNQSQYESSKQGRDVSRGMEQKMQNGERPGPVPIGYIKKPLLDTYGNFIKHGKDNKIVTYTGEDPELFSMVHKMWRMLLDGTHNVNQIWKIASTEWGMVAPKNRRSTGMPIQKSTVYRILTNPFYAGYSLYKGEMYKGNHRAMITLDEFDYAQTMLSKKGRPRPGAIQHAYTGLIRCGKCGCSVVAKQTNKFLKSKGQYTTYVHYYCTRTSLKRPCDQCKYTRIEDMEAQIDAELAKYTILPEFRDLALKVLRRNNSLEIKDRKVILEQQQKKRVQLQEQLDALIDMRTRNLLDDAEYTQKRNDFKLQILKADEALRDVDGRAAKWLELTEEVFDFATYARVRFHTGNPQVKRDILRTLGQKITLIDRHLIIEPNEWLQPLADEYPPLLEQYLKVRTNKKAYSSDKEQAFSQIFETWRARRDLNSRHPA